MPSVNDPSSISSLEWLARYAPKAAAARAAQPGRMWGSAPPAASCGGESCAACGQSEAVLDRAAWDLPLGDGECTSCSVIDYDAIRERLRSETRISPDVSRGGTE